MIPHLGARQLLTVLFIGLATFSSSTMALTARNYLDFFPAMTGATVNLTAMIVQPGDQEISVVFILENPTGYSGLGMRAFQASLTFKNLNGTVNQPYGDIPGLSRFEGPLGPHSKFEIPAKIPVIEKTWSKLAGDLANGKVTAEFQVTLNLSTFLDSFSWLYFHYDCNAGKAPVGCERTGTDAIPPQGGSGGGA